MNRPSIPAAAAAALIEYAGKVLSFDPADVEAIDFSVSRDICEVANNGISRRFKLGQEHLNLMIYFKPNASVTWLDKLPQE